VRLVAPDPTAIERAVRAALAAPDA